MERARFDQFLLENAAKKGVEVRRGARVLEVVFDADRAIGVQLAGEAAELADKAAVIEQIANLLTAEARLTDRELYIQDVYAREEVVPTGIGDLITYNSSVADYPKMFAAIASIILLAALAIQALERLERRLFPPEMRGFEDVS